MIKEIRFSDEFSYRHEALCGMFKSDATEAELVEEYLTEKYNL